MIELYVITSKHSNTPLAEIRTDGRNIDWVLDNTNGHLPQTAGGSYEKLKSIIESSSHLEMTTPEEATVGLLRYSLENGDIVEITTDGKTAQLNGQLMPEDEKFGLMSAIASGKIKVKNKADISTPLQLIPKAKQPKKEVPAEPAGDEEIKAIQRSREKSKAKSSLNNARKDSTIDEMKFEGTECPEMGRQLLYLLKYGENDA